MKLVILDRDGVINEDSDQFIKSADEYVPIPGSMEAIARLSANGYKVAVATNQSGIARGLLSLADLEGIHDRLRELAKSAGGRIEKIVFCPHGPYEDCQCRKPNPGLIDQIIAELGEPDFCFMVGDNLRDLQAGLPAGAQPLLVRTGKGDKTMRKGNLPQGTRIFLDLPAAVDWILAQK